MTDVIEFRFYSDRYGRIASIERDAAEAFRLTPRGLVGRDARIFFRKQRDALNLALQQLAATATPQYLDDLSFHPREANGQPVHLTLTEIHRIPLNGRSEDGPRSEKPIQSASGPEAA